MARPFRPTLLGLRHLHSVATQLQHGRLRFLFWHYYYALQSSRALSTTNSVSGTGVLRRPPPRVRSTIQQPGSIGGSNLHGLMRPWLVVCRPGWPTRDVSRTGWPIIREYSPPHHYRGGSMIQRLLNQTQTISGHGLHRYPCYRFQMQGRELDPKPLTRLQRVTLCNAWHLGLPVWDEVVLLCTAICQQRA